MGMSAETFWGGLEGNASSRKKLEVIRARDRADQRGGAQAALDAFRAKTVAALTPYQPVGDEAGAALPGGSGYRVSNVVGLKCDTATSIAPRRRAGDRRGAQ
jgi:maleate isomerase